MQKRDRPTPFRPSLSLCLLAALLAVLWLAGGASRPNVLGQVVVRSVAWVLMMAGLLFVERPQVGPSRPVLALMLAATLLAVAQIIPLPPAVWQSLPGRGWLAEAVVGSGQAQPWRPWAIVPGAAINAASSLIVPAVALFFMLGVRRSEDRWLLTGLLGLLIASILIGLLQFSGAISGFPFVNASPGTVSGTFANRNHLALFIAFGFLLVPAWAFLDGRRPGWRGPVALGLVALLVLMILAIGSRAGLMLGVVGLGGGLMLAWSGIRKEIGQAPRWVFPAAIAALVALVGIIGLISISADRADAIKRVFSLDVGQDMRHRGAPVVVAMIRDYFPMGSGLGGFDPVFRIHEPFELLKPTFFNHAHDDYLEVALDTGLFGIVLLLAGVAWWGWASVRTWRAGSHPRYMLPKLGSAMLLMILIASAFDYPARTPMIMAMIVIAAVWLAGRPAGHNASALPDSDQHL